MQRTSKISYLLISTVFFIIFDIFFSGLIIDSVRYKMPDNPLLDLIYVQNTGAAFSILENSKIFLIGFSIIAIAAILVYGIKNIHRYSVFTLYWISMLVAGIACNLYERIAFGYVRDFFKLNFVNFPVFNISDIFINVGVFAIVVIIIKHNYITKKQ